MQFVVTGTTQSSSGAFGAYCMDIMPGSNPNGLDCTIAANASFPHNGTPLIVSQSLPIVFGQPVTYTVGFLVYGHLLDFRDPNVGFTADYSHTSVLGGFVVDDSSGRQLTNFNVISGSGTTYSAVTIPEPSTFLMFVAAISLIALWRRRKLARD
jgi:hypothetical protein